MCISINFVGDNRTIEDALTSLITPNPQLNDDEQKPSLRLSSLCNKMCTPIKLIKFIPMEMLYSYNPSFESFRFIPILIIK